MIFLAVVRLARCEICTGQWQLEPGELPDRCAHCGTTQWQYGPEEKDSRLIRQGIKRLRRTINKGVTSKKRQEHGKRQWRGFKPKPEGDGG